MDTLDINVLVVEDNRDDALFLERVLTDEGYNVWLAAAPREAARLLRTTVFFAVVTELYIEGVSAAQLSCRVWETNKNIGVVVLAGYESIPRAVEAMESGIFCYLTKPLNAPEVRMVVKRAIEWYYLKTSCEDKNSFAELSVKDALTGTYNRRFLSLFLAKKAASFSSFAVIMFDIDFFKKYNDAQGHQAGDALLRDVSKVFQDSVRTSDAVFRYGGEEFLIFLDMASKESAALIAERIRNAVSVFVPATVSGGVAAFPQDGGTVDTLIAAADSALYRSKETGRNKITVASSESTEI